MRNRIRSNFWIIPALYGVCAALLAMLSVVLDRYMAKHGLTKYVPEIFLTDKELAHTILSAISTSLLTMTTITFSSVLVVQTTFLAQFSPRTLQNFNANSKTQGVLGTFVGGYIYALLLLIQVRNNDISNTFIVPSFAMLAAFICLGMFVFLIHHVTDWIKVGNLISNITKETLASILENNDENQPEAAEGIIWEEMDSVEIKSKKRGYIQYIDMPKMVEFAKSNNILIKFEKVHGNYVDVDTPLVTVWSSSEWKMKKGILDFIFITADQVTIQDVTFGIQKLVEIALRGIAPGKNDPETAISCIEQLSQILTKIGKNHSFSPLYPDEEGKVRVVLEKPVFLDYLYKSFYQIRHYGRTDVSIMTSVIKALSLIAETNGNEIKGEVWDFSEYIVEGIKREDWLELDKKFLNIHLEKLAKACGHEQSGSHIID
jgi:uncharacterized membrane protein